MKLLENIIAIDGPSASGKSSVAKKVAERLGWYYASTGEIYRGITLYILDNSNLDIKNAKEEDLKAILKNINLNYLDGSRNLIIAIDGKALGDRMRMPIVTEVVSYVAKSKVIREWAFKLQRDLVRFSPIVVEGRDIGSVIFPEAKYKFFLTASPMVRAKRRLLQRGEIPSNADIESVAKYIAERDRIDSSRDVAPLIKAKDAILIDSSDLTIDQVVDFIVKIVKKESE